MERAGGRELGVLKLLGGSYGKDGVVRGEAVTDGVEVYGGACLDQPGAFFGEALDDDVAPPISQEPKQRLDLGVCGDGVADLDDAAIPTT